MIDWAAIDTVLLDMDGTLLDLNFDTVFWTEHLPKRWAEARNISYQEARSYLLDRLTREKGQLSWYCIDYWTRELGMDVGGLKREIEHLIGYRPEARDFLKALGGDARRSVLVTNAHRKSLDLKLELTDLGAHLDAIVCSHDYATPKEDPGFWTLLQHDEPFEPARTLLIDDSPAVLDSAAQYGIGQLLGVSCPDSGQPPRRAPGYSQLERFSDIAFEGGG